MYNNNLFLCLNPLANFPQRQEPCLTHFLRKGLAWWLMLERLPLNADEKNKGAFKVVESSLRTADILHISQYQHQHHHYFYKNNNIFISLNLF